MLDLGTGKMPHTLGAAVDEDGSLLDKVLWDIDELLELFGHFGGWSELRWLLCMCCGI